MFNAFEFYSVEIDSGTRVVSCNAAGRISAFVEQVVDVRMISVVAAGL